MHSLSDVERRLRLPAPDEPTILPALRLPSAGDRPFGRLDGRVRFGPSAPTAGFEGFASTSPRLILALLLLATAMIAAIATGALRLDRLPNPFSPTIAFAERGISIDYPHDWVRLTPGDPLGSSGASTYLIASSVGIDHCSSDDDLGATPPPAVESGGVVVGGGQQGTIFGLEDRMLACVIARPMADGETRLVVARGMPQILGVGPYGDFDPELFFGGLDKSPEFAPGLPTAADGWTELIDGSPAKLVVSPTSVTAGAGEVRTWILYQPGVSFAVWYVQLVLDGPDVESLRAPADEIARSVRFDVHPPALEVATRDTLLAKAIDDLDRETRRSQGTDIYGCFPRAPGSRDVRIDQRLVDHGAGGRLPEPVPVTCTTAIEATPLGLWRATLVVSWQAGDGYAAGQWGWELRFDGAGAGGMQGQLFGPESMGSPGRPDVLPPPLAGPLVIPVGSVVEVLPPGLDGNGPAMVALSAEPNSTLEGRTAVQVPPGTRLAVVDGPMTHAGFDWYLVELQHGRSYPSEFLWAPATDGVRPLLGVVDPACPAAGPSVADLVAMHPADRLRCFGKSELTLDPATVLFGDPFTGGNEEVVATPRWLAADATWRLFGSGGPEGLDGAIPFAIDPSLGDAVPTNKWLVVHGHFDDAAASACTRAYPPAWGFEEPATVDQIRCRELFVVTGYEPRSAP
ncbi:MAG: hypothetical protein ABIV26_05950 [Candidatus Limnocylindrales bacterium]